MGRASVSGSEVGSFFFPLVVPTSHAVCLRVCVLVRFPVSLFVSRADRSRYASAFDRAYLSQFQVGSINESAAARAVHEAKEGAAPTDADAAAALINPAPASAPAASASSSSSGPDSLPLNKLLRPGAIVTVETVKSVHSARCCSAIPRALALLLLLQCRVFGSSLFLSLSLSLLCPLLLSPLSPGSSP